MIGALTVTLILNFAMAGFITVRFVRDYAYHQVSKFTDAEPSEAVREAFRQALLDDRRAFLRSLRDLGQSRNRHHELLTAETFDPAALEQAQGDVRTAALSFIDVLQRALRSAASELPDAERQAIPKLSVGALSKITDPDQ
ncbi:MAG: periplasmic heavy metal sensor [Geminicoccaceae bacterium]